MVLIDAKRGNWPGFRNYRGLLLPGRLGPEGLICYLSSAGVDLIVQKSQLVPA